METRKFLRFVFAAAISMPASRTGFVSIAVFTLASILEFRFSIFQFRFSIFQFLFSICLLPFQCKC